MGGTGTVVLNGLNTFTGATTINSGHLQIGGSGRLNAGSYAGAIGINSGSRFIYSSDQTQTLSGVISGPGGITKDTSSSVLTLSATNLYTGPTTVNAGTLRVGAAAGGQAFGGGSAVTLANTSGVTLDLNNFSQTIGSLAGGGTTGGNVTLGTGNLTTGGNNASTTFGGAISGSGGLTKNGSGTMTLTGTNSYTGATAVNAGTLALVGSSLTSAVTVANGASLGFTLGSPASNSSTVNLTNGTVKITGTPTLSSYTLMTTGGITGTPTLDAAITGYALVVDDTTLKLNSTGSGSSYTAWKTTNSVTGDPDDDQDGDGVSNAIEFLLGGTTGTNDLDKLPVASSDGTNMTFVFKRKAGILDGINSLVIEVDTDLSGWETIYTVGATTGTSSAGVTVTLDTPSGFDTITLTVPVGSDPKKFARLKLLVNP